MQRKRCRGMSALWTIKRVHETNEAKTYACMRKGVLCKSSPVWRSGRDLCSTSTFLGTYIVQWKQVNRERGGTSVPMIGHRIPGDCVNDERSLLWKHLRNALFLLVLSLSHLVCCLHRKPSPLVREIRQGALKRKRKPAWMGS